MQPRPDVGDPAAHGEARSRSVAANRPQGTVTTSPPLKTEPQPPLLKSKPRPMAKAAFSSGGKAQATKRSKSPGARLRRPSCENAPDWEWELGHCAGRTEWVPGHVKLSEKRELDTPRTRCSLGAGRDDTSWKWIPVTSPMIVKDGRPRGLSRGE